MAEDNTARVEDLNMTVASPMSATVEKSMGRSNTVPRQRKQSLGPKITTMDATGLTTTVEKPSRNTTIEPLPMSRTQTEQPEDNSDDLLHAYYARMNALHERLNLEIYNKKMERNGLR